MHKIRTINNISEKGLSRFPADRYELGDAIVAGLDEMKFWTEVLSEYMEWDANSA